MSVVASQASLNFATTVFCFFQVFFYQKNKIITGFRFTLINVKPLRRRHFNAFIEFIYKNQFACNACTIFIAQLSWGSMTIYFYLGILCPYVQYYSLTQNRAVKRCGTTRRSGPRKQPFDAHYFIEMTTVDLLRDKPINYDLGTNIAPFSRFGSF